MHFFAVTPREVRYAEGVSIIQPSEPSGRGAGGEKGKGRERCRPRLPWEIVPRIPYAESVESSEVPDTL
jgi:hypothetical protein